MAYYEKTFGTGNSKITGKICISATSNGASANTSNVAVSVYFSRPDGYSSYGTINTGVQCDSQSQWENGYKITVGKNGSWAISFAKNFYNVPHNSDGSKNCYFRCVGSANFSLGSFDSNWTLALDKIPRYTSITKWECVEVGKTYAKFNWAAADTVDWAGVYLNDSTQYWDVSNSGGTVIYEGLTPGTEYKLKLSVRRKDSGLYTTSSNVTFTTNPVMKITNLSGDFNYTIGNNLSLTFSNASEANKSWLAFDVNVGNGWEQVLKTDQTIKDSSYTWALSSYASTLFSKIPNDTRAETRIRCGATITENGKSITVTGSSIEGFMLTPDDTSVPTFSDFSLANEDTTTKNLLGNTSYMMNGYGKMVIRISTSQKAVAVNSASMSKYYVTVKKSSSTYSSFSISYSPSSEVSYNIGALSTGSYTVSIYAQDSRGYNSKVITKSFTVLEYSKPKFTSINLKRLNDYEQEVVLDFVAQFARLNVNGTDKNTSCTIKYRYVESGGSYPSSYNTINGATSGTVDSNYKKLTFAQNTSDNTLGVTGVGSSQKVILSNDKSYSFEIVISDSYTSASYQFTLSQGIPIFFMADNGMVTVGMVPDISRTEKIQVNGDIMAIDSYGNKYGIFERMDKMCITSETEPTQPVGGIWYKSKIIS